MSENNEIWDMITELMDTMIDAMKHIDKKIKEDKEYQPHNMYADVIDAYLSISNSLKEGEGISSQFINGFQEMEASILEVGEVLQGGDVEGFHRRLMDELLKNCENLKLKLVN